MEQINSGSKRGEVIMRNATLGVQLLIMAGFTATILCLVLVVIQIIKKKK